MLPSFYASGNLVCSLHPTAMHIVWHLAEEEKQLARAEAHRRQAANEMSGLRGRNNGPEHGAEALKAHMLGAGGEVALRPFWG